MDWLSIKEIVKRYRWPGLIILLGVLLLLIPGKDTEKQKESGIIDASDNILSVEEALSEILSAVKGAGTVKVMLSVEAGEETIYQSDGTSSQNDTVIISDSQRNQVGLVRQINPPVYLGAIIVCQGADDPAVRLSLTDAVAKVTGLRSDKITILKMK